MYLLSFLDARDRDGRGRLKYVGFLKEVFCHPAYTLTLSEQNSHLIPLAFSHDAYHSTMHIAVLNGY